MSTKTREEYRQQAGALNSVAALAIRHPGGLYFAGFGGRPEKPLVKWSHTLADARLFNASAEAQAEKYIERIKAKDSLYIGMKVVKVCLDERPQSNAERGAKQKVSHTDGEAVSAAKSRVVAK